MFSRAYKTVVTVPPLAWVTVFLLAPYLLMFCYSFWSVSPGQAIVHSWNLENYNELMQKTVYWQTLLRSMWIAARVMLFSLLPICRGANAHAHLYAVRVSADLCGVGAYSAEPGRGLA